LRLVFRLQDGVALDLLADLHGHGVRELLANLVCEANDGPSRHIPRCGALAFEASLGSLPAGGFLGAGLLAGDLLRRLLRRLLGGLSGRRFLLRGGLLRGGLFGGARVRHVGAVRAFVGLDVLERAVGGPDGIELLAAARVHRGASRRHDLSRAAIRVFHRRPAPRPAGGDPDYFLRRAPLRVAFLAAFLTLRLTAPFLAAALRATFFAPRFIAPFFAATLREAFFAAFLTAFFAALAFVAAFLTTFLAAFFAAGFFATALFAFATTVRTVRAACFFALAAFLATFDAVFATAVFEI